MAEAQRAYGKPLFFSMLQAIPVKNEPEKAQETETKHGNRKRKTE